MNRLQDPIGRAPVEGARLRPDQDRIDEEQQNSFIGLEREARKAPAAQAGPQPEKTASDKTGITGADEVSRNENRLTVRSRRNRRPAA